MFPDFEKDSRDAVPRWAAFLSQKEYSVFIDELKRYLTGAGIPFEIGEGEVTLGGNNFGYSGIGLINLAQTCSGKPPGRFRDIIAGHFEALRNADAFDDKLLTIMHDFDQVKQYLGVRLYNDEYVKALGTDGLIYRRVVGDVIAMLVYDLPHSVINVKPEDATYWPCTGQELFDLGIANIRRNYPQQVSLQTAGGFRVWFISNNHFFTGNIIFDFDIRPEFVGRKGSLVCLPNRHAAMVHPIEDKQVIKAISGLITAADGMFRQGPGSLSPLLFWYRNGEFIDLPYQLTGDAAQFQPPEEFTDMLGGLMEET